MEYQLLAVPFTGFYSTKWGALIDSAVEDEKARMRDRYDIPEELEGELTTTSEWNCKAEKEIGEAYAEVYVGLIEQYLGIKSTIKSIEIDSPTYYNYRNDRLLINVGFEMDYIDLVHKLMELSLRYRDELLRIIEEEHTSCSGFISFMSDDFDEWKDIMMEEDSVNCRPYIDCLISYLLYLYMNDSHSLDDDGIDWTIYDSVSHWFENAVPEFEVYPEYDDEWEEFKEKMRKQDEYEIMLSNQPKIPGLFDE